MMAGRAVFVALVLSLLAAAPVWGGGYGELRRELRDYRPPAVVGERMRPVAAVPVPRSGAESDRQFAAQLTALRSEADAWGRELVSPRPQATFYVLDPQLRQTMAPVAADPARLAETLRDGFTLKTLEGLVLLRNPEIKAKEEEVQAALSGYSQVEDLDTILRRYASFTRGLMTGIGPMTDPAPAALSFPFPGVLALKGQVVTQETKAALEELEIARREALTSTRRDYAELVYRHAAYDLAATQLALLDSLRRVVETKYQSGGAGFQDLTAVDIERETTRQRLADRKEDIQDTEATIGSLVLAPEDMAVGRPAAMPARPAPPPLARLYRLADSRNQELRLKKAMIGRLERLLALSETMIYPGLASNLSSYDQNLLAGGNEAGGGFPVTSPAATGLGLPKMPWFGSDDAYLRQTRRQLAAQRQNLKELRAGVTLKVREAWTRWDKARRRERLYRGQVAPLSQAGLEAARQGYAAGRVGFSDLIKAADARLDAKLNQARALADIAAAQAELAAAVGVSEGVW